MEEKENPLGCVTNIAAILKDTILDCNGKEKI